MGLLLHPAKSAFLKNAPWNPQKLFSVREGEAGRSVGISATEGNDISTFPDYPADIRAPQGSLTGVSGFQVHIGAGKVYTPADSI